MIGWHFRPPTLRTSPRTRVPMIRSLAITNLAVIESVSVHFEPAFNVLTGETGAGKSMLVGAVGLLIGGRASADLVRTGAELATIEAVFEAADRQTVVVRREVSAAGPQPRVHRRPAHHLRGAAPAGFAVHRAARTARAPAPARSPDPSSAASTPGPASISEAAAVRDRWEEVQAAERALERAAMDAGERGRQARAGRVPAWRNWTRRSWWRVRTRSLAQTRDVLRHAEPADRALPRILRPALRRRGARCSAGSGRSGSG